jgi:uncharacterized membrane protein YfcA
MNFDYWYVFPYAIFVCICANVSGFSGSVLFQPFFNFVLGVPIAQSIATGIATETIGMTSGSIGHWRAKNGTDVRAVKFVLPFVFAGIFSGLFLFIFLPKLWLRLLVGVVIFSIASYQLYLAFKGHTGFEKKANLKILGSFKCRLKQFFAGVGSASTGTGVAEMHQPMFEQDANLEHKRANATAILIEALGNWLITFFNLSMGNIRLDILIFSAAGVAIGGQIGPYLTKYVPDRIGKAFFGISVCSIGIIYIITSLQKLLT